jgi:hypothetical protein
MTLSITLYIYIAIIQCIYAECHYAECRYAECRYAECPNSCIVMVSVVMLNVVIPNVGAPKKFLSCSWSQLCKGKTETDTVNTSVIFDCRSIS